MLFDAAHGVLIAADALWEDGFGVVFPEIDGEPGFDDVGTVLDLDRAAAGARGDSRPRRAVHRRGGGAGTIAIAAGEL